MAKPTPWKDEYTLLCERCGYIIEDLDQSLPCPECGKPMSESIPEHRVGTAWQQNQCLQSLVQTMKLTLRSPIEVLRIARPFNKQTRTLRRIYQFGAGIWWTLMTLIFIGYSVSHINASHNIDLLITFYSGILIFALLITPFVMFLSWIETLGIVFLSKRRNGRIDKDIARSITSHGSIGWLIGSIGGSTCFLLWAMLSLQSPWLSETLGWIGSAFVLTGFLFFETFAYLGLRRCKYANTIRPQSIPPQAPKP